MAQANSLAAILAPKVGPVEIVRVRTSGDAGNRDKLGAFVSEIEEAVLAREVDLALHCLKDIPTEVVEGLDLIAYLERDDPRDAILTVSAKFEDLQDGATVGTGSLRRTSQLAAHGKKFLFKPLLGNVDTRLAKLRSGEYDAIVLAMAGLNRLGLGSEIHHQEGTVRVEPLDIQTMVPCAGQATLAIQMRDDHPQRAAISELDHAPTRACSVAERAFLHRFGGGCSVPVGAYAEPVDEHFTLHGLISSPDGLVSYRGTRSFGSEQAVFYGRELAESLGEQGGFEILSTLASSSNSPVTSAKTASGLRGPQR
jgi:hydroxymethylbilane synthase